MTASIERREAILTPAAVTAAVRSFGEGDLVQAEKGESLVKGRVETYGSAGFLYLGGRTLQRLVRRGYTLTLLQALGRYTLRRLVSEVTP
ncbi:hypothetical protein N1031_06805 [Herbiconiux moechotypicola]|uniref:Uncharacterized protein n=1 Tax=Herbiconiux moechotypicola TaxID=637393 RepID=A0ABP5QA51_9MICO|nr:hypothetical protein [Herbiconiux moechotypicola]MCS5729467.1 hypothetical protein [Herbiconiux moechotypicola]